MIKLSNLKVSAHIGEQSIAAASAKALKIPEKDITEIKILKKSVDARKGEASFVFTLALKVKNEAALIKKGVQEYIAPEKYEFPYKNVKTEKHPVIVGMGPAGLFAALTLAEAGVQCIVLERGRPVEKRTADIEKFWQTGKLSETSNVQFGEGGAGTFSDGKLTTGVNDTRISYILEEFVKYGAPADIIYNGKPHIGTDKLRTVVAAMRKRLIELGCDIRFENKFEKPIIKNGKLTAVEVTSANGRYMIETDRLILAVGNSARDTFENLDDCGLIMEAKPFSVGVRIEHLQKDIDAAQYKQAATLGTLPASNYKLAVHLKNGRTAYTFCVCPGGYVVAAASEYGGVVTNGMSEYARDGENINGGLLVSVSASDFDDSFVKAIEFQRKLEEAAFKSGGENYCAPAQTVGDFMAKKPSKGPGKVKPTYKPSVKWCNLWEVLPDFVCESIFEALPEMDKKIKGFSSEDAVLTAVETRSSCPVRIKREDYKTVGIEGIYPCGEGAGYAGGIMSAAVDGIRCAEKLCSEIM